MKLSKKTAALAVTYISAALLVLGGFVIQQSAEAARLRREADVSYARAFSQLSDSVDAMSTALQKSLYAGSPSMESTVCAEIYARSQSAQAALGMLPYADVELSHTSSFIGRVGDYACALSRSAAAGTGLGDGERSNLSSLSDSAAQISRELDGLQSQLLAGGMDIRSLERAQDALSADDDEASQTGAAVSISEIETDFPELPALIYDGPFSEHITGLSPKLLEGEAEVAADDAILSAARFCGMDKSRLSLDHVREDEIPVYVLTGDSRGGTLTVEVTKAGGRVLYFRNTRPVETAAMTAEEAVKLAGNFLRRSGYASMKETYWSSDGSAVTVNYAFEQSGVVCYPDLVKVTVALDSGSVTGFDSRGYVMCHTARSIPDVKADPDEAQAKLSPALTVVSRGLAIIPTAGKNEVFCHEFRCMDEQGRNCLVYVGAETGIEEKILILLEDESGTLTI